MSIYFWAQFDTREKRAERLKKTQYGYIMEVKDATVTIRPELHAPEVDEYDEIAIKKISV